MWPGSSASCLSKFWSSFLLSFLDCSSALNPMLFIWPRAFQDRTRVRIQICIGWRGTCGNHEGYWTIGRNRGQWKKYHEKTSLDQKSVYRYFLVLLGFPGGSEVKTSARNAGDPGSIPGSGRSPGEGNGNALQYSCLENPMDRGAWWYTVPQGRKESDTTERLHFHFHYTLGRRSFSMKGMKNFEIRSPAVLQYGRAIQEKQKVFLFKIFILLKYSWFTMLCSFLLWKMQSDSVIHMHIFFIFISIMVYHRILNIVPCTIELWLIHSVYNSLHLLFPTSQFCPPRTSPPATTTLFSMSLKRGRNFLAGQKQPALCQLFMTPWIAAHMVPCPSPSISWILLKLMSIESVMLFNHLILCHALLLMPSVFPSIRVFSNELVLCIRSLKYWSFSFSISLSNEYSGLISFSIDWFDLLAIQGTLKSLL